MSTTLPLDRSLFPEWAHSHRTVPTPLTRSCRATRTTSMAIATVDYGQLVSFVRNVHQASLLRVPIQTPTGRSLESLSATLKSVFGSITLGSKKTNKSSGDSWICFPSGRRTFLLLLFESFSFLMKTMRKILKKIGFVMMVKRRDILISFLKRRRMDLKFPLFKETRYIPPPPCT